MTRMPAFMLILLSISTVLMGSGHAQNLGLASAVDSNAGANFPIIWPLGAATSTNRTAQVSDASLDGTYSRQVAGMELTLQQYRAAIENLSVVQVRQVWPGLDRRREAALKQAFEYLRSMSARPKMGLQCAAPVAVEESTKVECRETLTYNDARGKPQHVKPARVSILLRKEGDKWIVDNMK